MQIIHFPHPALRYKSTEIKQIDPTLTKTIRTMFNLMYEAKGIGLAANQVGLPLRFFIVNLAARPDEPDEELVFINPVIKKRKGLVQGEEGCLSLPGFYSDVKRSEEIVVEAFDLEGRGFEMELNDLPARVVQHETDHLDGIMFTDKIAEASDEAEVADALSRFTDSFDRLQQSEAISTNDMITNDLKSIAQKGIVPPEFLDRPNVELNPPEFG